MRHDYINCLYLYHIWNIIRKYHNNFTENLTKIKLKRPEKIERTCFFIDCLFLWSCINYIKLFEYNFWWNCLEFSCKMYLTNQMRILINVKHRHAICLKFREGFFTSLKILGLEAKASICSIIKEILIFFVVRFWHLLTLP